MSAPTAADPRTCGSCGRMRLPGAEFCGYCGARFAPPATQSTVRRLLQRRMPKRTALPGRGSDLYYVIAAAVLAVILSDLPYLNMVIYPFRLFETLVHEWSHALVAIVTGGQVVELKINPNDFSGETDTSGGWLLPIFSAGYIGAAVAGALLLLAPTRLAKRTLIGIGAASLLMPIIGVISFGTTFPAGTWLWTALFSVAALGVGWRAAPRLAGIFQQFIAVELCFKAIDDLRVLAWYSLNDAKAQTDASNAAGYTHLPAIIWTVLWGVVAIAAIALSIRRVVRRSLP